MLNLGQSGVLLLGVVDDTTLVSKLNLGQGISCWWLIWQETLMPTRKVP